jgi:6-phosphogluconate dehydrogenase
VIRSWLLDLTAEFLAEDDRLESIAPVVADSGEGRWTALESIELGVPTPVMTLALMQRFDSQGRGDFANRVLARMRQSFGGHAVTHRNAGK